MPLERAVLGFIAVGVAARAVDAHHGDNVASRSLVDLLALVRVHSQDAAKPFLAAGALIDVGLALSHRALIDSHEGELTVRVVGDLEGHRDKRLLGVGDQRHSLFGILPIASI